MDANFTNSPPPDDERHRQHRANLERLKAASESLGEHFDGVVILAHVLNKDTQSVVRYSALSGDPLAAQQLATMYVNENGMRYLQGGSNNAT